MPEEDFWESLLDVPGILDALAVGPQLGNVIELGCGYGTFTIPVAKRISGMVYSFDIDPLMIERSAERCANSGVSNVKLILRDVAVEGFGTELAGDACLLFNILHANDPGVLLHAAAAAVRVGGTVLAIHWRYDPSTPRGPSLDIRPRPEQIITWAEKTGRLGLSGSVIDLPPWHYGLKFIVID